MPKRKSRKNTPEEEETEEDEEFDDDDNDDGFIKDEELRTDIKILSARLYDLRERFMKLIDKVNENSNELLNQISDTDDTPAVKNTSKRRIIDEDENDSTEIPDDGSDDEACEEDEEEGDDTNDDDGDDDDDNDDDYEEEQEADDDSGEDDKMQTQKAKLRSQVQKLSIESIVKRQAQHYEYFKYITQYPQIMKHLTNDDKSCTNVPLRYLEPFIKDHVHKNPNGRIYDKINEQIQEIRAAYLQNRL